MEEINVLVGSAHPTHISRLRKFRMNAFFLQTACRDTHARNTNGPTARFHSTETQERLSRHLPRRRTRDTTNRVEVDAPFRQLVATGHAG